VRDGFLLWSAGQGALDSGFWRFGEGVLRAGGRPLFRGNIPASAGMCLQSAWSDVCCIHPNIGCLDELLKEGV